MAVLIKFFLFFRIFLIQFIHLLNNYVSTCYMPTLHGGADQKYCGDKALMTMHMKPTELEVLLNGSASTLEVITSRLSVEGTGKNAHLPVFP